MSEQYRITPNQVSGEFTVTKVIDLPEDDYCYLFAQVGDQERCIVYDYPLAASGPVRQMQLPARCKFAEGYLIVLSQAAKPAMRYCPWCSQYHSALVLDQGWRCPLDRDPQS